MNSWSAWLLALGSPIAKRVLVALGFGIVSFAAAKTVVESAFASAQGALGGLGGETLAIVARSGAFDALSIIAGGVIGGLALRQLKKLSLLSS